MAAKTLDKLTAPEQQTFDLAILQNDTSMSDMLEALNENTTGGFKPWNLDRVTIPTGGAIAWTIPTLEKPDGELTRELIGVPLAFRDTRVYYQGQADGTARKPDCKSDDGITGVGNPAGGCASCKFSQWFDNQKPPCKKQIEIFLLTEQSALPILIVLSPASLAPWNSFMLHLGKNGIRHYGAVLKLELEKAFAGNIAYSKLKPSFVQRLGAQQSDKLKIIRDDFMRFMSAQPAANPYQEHWQGEASKRALPSDAKQTPSQPSATPQEAPQQATAQTPHDPSKLSQGQVVRLARIFPPETPDEVRYAVYGWLLGSQMFIRGHDIPAGEFPNFRDWLEDFVAWCIKSGESLETVAQAATAYSVYTEVGI